MKEIANEIIVWLREMLQKTGAKGYILGLSGGIDSSVMAGLLARAVPGQCLGVILPAGSNPQDREDAIKTAEAFDFPYVELSLTDYRESLYNDVASLLKQLGHGEEPDRIVKGNIGSRLRMTALYGLGNSLGYLVVGTDNAAETYTGYFTKYGDGGVDLLPLKHLGKDDVYRLGAWLGVPQSVMTKPPSAGFFEDQNDEAEMGVSYDTVDAYLRGDEIAEVDRQILLRLHRVSEHKRHLPPGLRDIE